MDVGRAFRAGAVIEDARVALGDAFGVALVGAFMGCGQMHFVVKLLFGFLDFIILPRHPTRRRERTPEKVCQANKSK